MFKKGKETENTSRFDIKEMPRDGIHTVYSVSKTGQGRGSVMTTEDVAYVISKLAPGREFVNCLVINNLDYGKTGGIVLVTRNR